MKSFFLSGFPSGDWSSSSPQIGGKVCSSKPTHIFIGEIFPHPRLNWGNFPTHVYIGKYFPTHVYIGGKFSLCVAQHIHQISSLIWPETQLISVQSSRLLLVRVEMNRRGLVLLKHKRRNHQISLLTPLQKRIAMIMLIIRMAPYDVKSVLDPGSDSILRDLFC